MMGFYCDFLTQEEQSAKNMLGAILKQLVSQKGVLDHIREAFQKAKNEFSSRSLQLPDMVEILKKAITSLRQVFICFDALDECTPKHRRELLESLREIVQVSPNLRVFLTARPNIDDEIVRYFIQVVKIPLCPTHSDIESYLNMRLSRDPQPDLMNRQLREDIMRIIPETISEK